MFLPVFFAGKMFHLEILSHAFLAFLAFSLTASAVYIFNDLQDIESDKKHPVKRFRPLASGKISKVTAVVLLLFCLVFAALILIYEQKTKESIIIGFYLLMNVAYSLKLKQIAILDVSIIAFGFLLRVLAGGYSTGLLVTEWAIYLTFFLALILAIGKRRGEIINAQIKGETRKSLHGYNLEFLNHALVLISGITIVSYIMYVLTPGAQNRFGTYILYSTFLVIIAILRYLQMTFVFNKTESPTRLVYKDTFLQVIIIAWATMFAALIYFKHGLQ